jgi:hypothetical protein
MPNRKGWLTKNEMMDTGMPCFIPDAVGALTGRWYGSPPGDGIMLTRTRCAQLDAAVKDSEEAVAFFYVATIAENYRYIPFYHRKAEELNVQKINQLEKRTLCWSEKETPEVRS